MFIKTLKKLLFIFLILIQILGRCSSYECTCSQCRIDDLPDNCTSIVGHILIGLESTMPPYEIIDYKLGNIAEVTGCITIANSGFTSLNFMSNLQKITYSETGKSETCAAYGNTITIAKNSLLRRLNFGKLEEVFPMNNSDYGLYIYDNPSLCISEDELERFLKTPKFYAPHISICNPSRKYCKLDNLDFFNDKNMQNGCEVLTDSLVLNGTKVKNISDFQRRNNSIEQIFGSVIIMNTNLQTVKLPKLWRIYNYQPTLPVILIQKNQNLTTISLDSLKSVPFKGDFNEFFYAFHNPNLTQISKNSCENFQEIGNISIDGSDEICAHILLSESASKPVPPTSDTSLSANSTNSNSALTLNAIEKSPSLANPNEEGNSSGIKFIYFVHSLVFLIYF